MTQVTVWKPHVTVAAVVERHGKFLMVEERTERGVLFNQPAGHLEPGESLAEGAVREALEETAYVFRPDALLGVYHLRHAPEGVTYLRFAFLGNVTGPDPGRPLDEGIIRAVWLTADEIRAEGRRHRSPLVLRCIDDYLAGKRYPLELLTHHAA